MATSLGETLPGLGQHVASRGPLLEYVVLATSVSTVLGVVVLPRLLSRQQSGTPGPACPPPPPCVAYCLCGKSA